MPCAELQIEIIDRPPPHAKPPTRTYKAVFYYAVMWADRSGVLAAFRRSEDARAFADASADKYVSQGYGKPIVVSLETGEAV